MNDFRLLRIFSVLFALTVCTSYLGATALDVGTPTINLTCTVGQTCTAQGTSTIAYHASNVATYYAINAANLPSWLWVTPMSGIIPDYGSSPNYITLTFQVSPAWANLAAGFRTYTVGISSANVVVNLEVQNATPTLVVKGATSQLNALTMNTGAAPPTMQVQIQSSNGLALPYSVAVTSNPTPEGVTGWLTGNSSGTLFSWGTTLSIVASAAATTQQAVAGDVLTGNVAITTATQIVNLPVTITINATAATLTSINPTAVPLLASGVTAGAVTIVVKGTSFVTGTGTQKTSVFYGTTAATCSTKVSSDNVTVLSSTYLTVAIPYATTGVPFATAGTGTNFFIGVANNTGGVVPITAPSSATTGLTITASPIISGITSASAFVDNGGTPKAAPYDILTIWGSNFCPLCTGTAAVQVGAPDATYSRYPTYVTPDTSGTTHKVSVAFSKPGGGGSPANLPGYILMATNNQINVLVPGAISTLHASSPAGVNVIVGYDTVAPATTAGTTSAPFLVTDVVSNPGIFTIATNGQGQGAITDGITAVLNSASFPANVYVDGSEGHSTATIYVSGLGAPDSTKVNTPPSGSAVYDTAGDTDCVAPLGVAGSSSVAPTGFMGTVNTPYISASLTGTGYNPFASGYVVPGWTSIDGAIMRSAILQGNFPPCNVTAKPTVTIGGVTQTFANGGVTYAGFVPDSIAGLYQINVQVPQPSASLGTPPQQYPVILHINSVASQAGVTMWINY